MANKNIDGDVNVQFTEASSRQSLESGESIKTLFGKLRKWLSDLKPVAFSGSYGDLANKPTIPTVNDGTLIIQQNGTTKATFTANQSGSVTVDVQTGEAFGIDIYDDVLPLSITACGDSVEDWIIYGNQEGVGEYDAESGGYVLPIITKQRTVNLYNKDTKISGYRIQWATGALISWQSGQMSDYIEINQSSYKCTIPVFILGYTENYTYCGAFRDGAFVKESPSEFNESFTISDTNVKYIKLLNYAYPETVAYSFPDDMMLVEGNELPSSFIPYEYTLSSTIYLGASPLIEGQSLSKSQAATKDILTFNGECIIDTSLSNKPRMEIIPTDSAINIINRIADLTQKALIKEDDNAGGYVVDLDKDCKLQRNANYIYLRNNSINIHTDSSNINLQCGTTGSPLRGVQITNTAVRMYFGLNTLTVDEDGLWFNDTKIAE